MLHIYLPGFSPLNASEGEAITAALKTAGHEVYYHKWPHWEDESIEFKEDAEVAKIKAVIEKSGKVQFAFVAKSVGTLISMKLIEDARQIPEYMIMLGIPFQSFGEEKSGIYPRVLKSHPRIPLTIIQNEADPYGPAMEIQQLLTGVKYNLITKTGVENHIYNYPEDVVKFAHQHSLDCAVC